MSEKHIIFPEDWRILDKISQGAYVIESDTPNMGMPKSFTLGKRARTHYNSRILDNLAAHGFLDRATNRVTANGLLALAMHDAGLQIGGAK